MVTAELHFPSVLTLGVATNRNAKQPPAQVSHIMLRVVRGSRRQAPPGWGSPENGGPNAP